MLTCALYVDISPGVTNDQISVPGLTNHVLTCALYADISPGVTNNEISVPE